MVSIDRLALQVLQRVLKVALVARPEDRVRGDSHRIAEQIRLGVVQVVEVVKGDVGTDYHVHLRVVILLRNYQEIDQYRTRILTFLTGTVVQIGIESLDTAVGDIK